MLAEGLMMLFDGFLLGILDLLTILRLPLESVEALQQFCVYGSYVVGSDLLLLFSSLVFSWTVAKMSVGLGIRIWELLPLT